MPYLRISSTDSFDTPLSPPADPSAHNQVGPLSNIRFAVFGLGSSAYPNFCAFARFIDNILNDLGGERILKMHTGDELCGQEHSFSEWARSVFEKALDVFCIGDELNLSEVLKSVTLKPRTWSVDSVKLTAITEKHEFDRAKALAKSSNRRVIKFHLVKSIPLHLGDNERQTLRICLEHNESASATVKDTPNVEPISYLPGDHLGIFPENRFTLVRSIIRRLSYINFNTIYEIRVRKTGEESADMILHEKLLPMSIGEALKRFLDITTPPTRQFLGLLSVFAEDKAEREQISRLSNDQEIYEDWKVKKFPTFPEILAAFPSLKPPAEFIMTQLPILQPRFYSISSSQSYYNLERGKRLPGDSGEINEPRVDLTVAVVQYNTPSGDLHFGVCSNFLADIRSGHPVFGFFRSAPNFRLPDDPTSPVILVGPGTGVAPFRAFWLQRYAQCITNPAEKMGKMTLYFGCRNKEMELYADEVRLMSEINVITDHFVALSRMPEQPKKYVQDHLLENCKKIYQHLITQKGHLYVCGDVSMAEGVCQTLKSILQKNGINEPDVAIMSLREQMRYHEDIFGITLRTDEVRNKGRNDALSRKGTANA